MIDILDREPFTVATSPQGFPPGRNPVDVVAEGIAEARRAAATAFPMSVPQPRHYYQHRTITSSPRTRLLLTL